MKNTTNINATTEQKENLQETPFVEAANLRDYFAAEAMQSIVSAPHQMEDLIDTLGASTAYAKVSETAYVIADAMLRAREAS
ncbi:hypothetical protein [Huaxiibacter chinensis]|uniref:hypothetical protein n=1 Tax=Huaxiibacter chinensis TaxID=2899785 RepID=UPI003D317C0D